MKKTDLHIHTIYSDGSKTPEDILDLAHENNLSTIAITDHDNISGSKKIIELPHKGITIYSGVEMTAKYPHGKMHILGYNVDLDNRCLNCKLNEISEASKYNLIIIREMLKKQHGIELPEEIVENLLNLKGNIIYPKISYILYKLGYASCIRSAYLSYIKPLLSSDLILKKELTKEEIIELINNAGGVASLAHPGSLNLSREDLEVEISYLKRRGLGAIECFHSKNRHHDTKFYTSLAKKLDLLETGGSDFHGVEIKPEIMIGSGIKHNINLESNTLSFTKNIKSRY